MTPQVAPQVTPQVASVLEAASSACSFAELQAAAGMKDRIYLLKIHLEPLLLAGWIERTIPDKPCRSKQKDRLTEKGRQTLDKWTGDETQTVPLGSQREQNMSYVQDPKKQVGYLQQCLSSDKKLLNLFLYGERRFA